MNSAPLFEKLRLGALELPNRILMAPLTRCRAEAGHVPGPLMAEYYAQRASAGLIIAEATMALEGNSTFCAEPGIYNEAQIARWRGGTEPAVTDANLALGKIDPAYFAGGKIALDEAAANAALQKNIGARLGYTF